MNRWKVFRYKDEFGCTWVAGEIGNPWRSCNFRTRREALDYADRLARTREVVLPRITADMEDGVADWPNIRDLYMRLDHHDEPRLGQPYVEIMDNYGGLDVEMYDLRPLALVLLALAEQEEA